MYASSDTQHTAPLATTRIDYDSELNAGPTYPPKRGHVFRTWAAVSGAGTTAEKDRTPETYHYNSNGTLARIDRVYADDGGTNKRVLSTAFTYDGNGNMTSVDRYDSGTVDGSVSTHLRVDRTYDAVTGLLTWESDPYTTTAHSGTSYSYDFAGRLVAVGRQDSSGTCQVKAFQYTDANLATGLPGSVTSYAYTACDASPPTSFPTHDDIIPSYTYYDGLGRALQTRTRTGTGMTNAFPGQQQIGSLSNGFLVTGAITFDGAGRVVEAFEPYISASSSFADYWAGDDLYPKAASYPAHSTSFGYDSRGRKTCTVYWPTGAVPRLAPAACQSSYSSSASYVRATRWAYGVDTVAGDSGSYVTVAAVPDYATDVASNAAATTRYLDAGGRVWYEKDPNGNVVSYQYDTLGRQTALIRYPGAVGTAGQVDVLTSYDQLGRITQQVDRSFGTRRNTYYDSGELRSIITGIGADHPDGTSEVSFNYGSLGRVSTRSVRTFQGLGWSEAKPVAQYVYDTALGGTTGLVVDGQAVTRSNVEGRLSYEARVGGVTHAFGYDAQGRVSSETYNFDGQLQPVQQTPHVSVGFKYGVDGRLLSKTVASPYITSNASQQVASFYRYDSLGRLTRLDDGAPTTPYAYWSGVYDALGRVFFATLDNGNIQASRSWDANSNLPVSREVYFASTGAYLVRENGMQYTGTKLRGVVDGRSGPSAGSVSYGYDNLGRLQSAQSTLAFNESYTFDNLSNLSSVTALGTTTPTRYHYVGEGTSSATERLATIGADQFQSDENGSLTAQVGSDGQTLRQFKYDGEMHLTEIRGNSASTTPEEALAYGPSGALLSRTLDVSTNDNMSAYYFAGSDVTLAVERASGNVDVFVHVSKNVDVRVGAASATPVYFHRDRLGSVVATSVKNGTVPVFSYLYGPYGARTEQVLSTCTAVSCAAEKGYTGALTLAEGLVYMNARVYDTKTRRFLQSDDVDFYRYRYVGGDPVNGADPTGHTMKTQSNTPPAYRLDIGLEYSGGYSSFIDGGGGGGSGGSGGATRTIYYGLLSIEEVDNNSGAQDRPSSSGTTGLDSLGEEAEVASQAEGGSPERTDVTDVFIQRTTWTGDYILGKIFVVNPNTGETYEGYTLERASPPNPALPVPEGSYYAFLRDWDHDPGRIQLYGVPNADYVQVHEGNTIANVIGCWAVGMSQEPGVVHGSQDALSAINSIIYSNPPDPIVGPPLYKVNVIVFGPARWP